MLMVVSLDGFRPDYLFRVKPPMKNIKKIYQKGVLAPSGIIPCYATKTFPNHYSIATGLFEESHGIIDNEMYNANKTPAYFHFTSDAPDWWDNGLNMPVWILNEKKGQSSGIIMWPGGGEKIDNISVTHHVPFNSSVTLHSRIDLAFSFLTSSTSPANCIFLYFHQPDLVSHGFGPFSNETMKFLQEIDEGIGYLLEKIESYELENLLNLIVMSDHGVDVLLSSNQIQINDIAPTSICNVYGVGPISGVIPHPGKFEEVFSYLKQKSNIYNFTVTKRREFPDSAHFKNNDNVPEILIRTEPGYQFINKIDTGPAPYQSIKTQSETYSDLKTPNETAPIVFRQRDLMNKLKPKNVVCNTFIGSRSNQKKVICKLKLWTAAILNLCKLTTFPVSKSCRLFICSSEGPNKQVNAKKPSIAICSRSSPNLTGINGSTHDKVKRAGETFVLKLYGASSFESLDKYRHIAYKRAIGRCSPSSSFQLASLPPTSAAAKKHSYRNYHTVQEWMGNTLPPIEWGWRSHDGTLAPVETDRPVAPESLLNMGPNKQVNAKKPSIAICSRSSPNLTGINGSTHDKVKRAGETFVLKLYGASSFESLDKYRHIAYKRAIGRCSPSSSFQLASLPPTSAAAKKHSYRNYHTVQEWMGNTLPPIEWGWRSHDGTLAPVETDRPVAPESLLNMVS
ncbi:Bis(5'-adenosyl)-triphosphatase enpp4 [Nymphon striatum]|nr:Bis(5'-adenosyl)-triphosphatase enpp4 [Nymphon striatum]